MPARRDIALDQLNQDVLRIHGLVPEIKPTAEAKRQITKPEDVIIGLGETELSKTVTVLSPDDGAPEKL